MPVKLGEYLSSGLPVIVSRIAGWVDDIIDGAGAGIAVRWFGASEQERASAAANTRWTSAVGISFGRVTWMPLGDPT